VKFAKVVSGDYGKPGFETGKISSPFCKNTPMLGGGNSNIFHVPPEPWGNDPI